MPLVQSFNGKHAQCYGEGKYDQFKWMFWSKLNRWIYGRQLTAKASMIAIQQGM